MALMPDDVPKRPEDSPGFIPLPEDESKELKDDLDAATGDCLREAKELCGDVQSCIDAEMEKCQRECDTCCESIADALAGAFDRLIDAIKPVDKDLQDRINRCTANCVSTGHGTESECYAKCKVDPCTYLPPDQCKPADKERFYVYCNPETNQADILPDPIPPLLLRPPTYFVGQFDDLAAANSAAARCSGKPEDEEKKCYVYCNRQNGSVTSLPEQIINPPLGWELFGIGTTPSECSTISAAAKEQCKPDEPPKPPGFPNLYGPHHYCDWAFYNDVNNIAKVTAGGVGFLSAAIKNAVIGSSENASASGPFQRIAAEVTEAVLSVVVNTITELLGTVLAPISSIAGCTNASFTNPGGVRILIGLLRLLGMKGTDQVDKLMDQFQKRACPVGWPSVDECLATYMANAIDEETLYSWLSVNDRCSEPMQRVLEARRSKPIPHELASQRHRKLIDPAEYLAGMRRLGYLDNTEVENLWQTTFQLPTQTDLIRMMVRDTDDPNVVDRFGLDSDFGAKFGGTLKEWAEKQGVSEDIMRHNWRAHWTIPSPTALFEMYHRLSRLPAGDKSAVSLDDIKAALQQQDILPIWIDKFLAISHPPLTRIDVRRAYDIGELDFDELIEANMQQGYDRKNAEILAKFTHKVKQLTIYGSKPIQLWVSGAIDRQEASRRLKERLYDDGYIEDALDLSQVRFTNNKVISVFAASKTTADVAKRELDRLGVDEKWQKYILGIASAKRRHVPIVDQFIAGQIEPADAVAALQAEFMDAETAKWKIDTADKQQTERVNRRCARALVKRFLGGEMNAADLRGRLKGFGFSNHYIGKLVNAAQCEAGAFGKDPGTAQLCGWFDLGLIDVAQFGDRLRSMGWHDVDADRIVFDCMSKLNAKRMAEAKRQFDKQVADDEKKRRAIERANKASQANLVKLAKARENAIKAKQRRDQLLFNAAEYYVKVKNVAYADAVQAVSAVRRAVKNAYALNTDQSYQVTLQAAEALFRGDESDLQDLANRLAVEILANEESQLVLSGVGSFNTNGKLEPSG